MAHSKVPEYTISALAALRLQQHFEEHPLALTGKQDVHWEVEETDYHYVAKGTVNLPVEIYFGKPEDVEEEPEVRRVIVAGKREFDARLDELDEEEVADGNYGVNKDAVNAQSFKRFKGNLS